MNAICGVNVSECLAMFDPATRSLKTSQLCLPLNPGDSSTELLQTWPRFGMLVSGKLYPLPPLALPTEEIESGCSASMSWPTPDTSQRGHGPSQMDRNTPPLASEVLKWATPSQRDHKGHTITEAHPEGFNTSLANQVLWPMPTSAEGSKIGSQANFGQVGLSNHPAIVGEPTRDKLAKSGQQSPATGQAVLDSHSTDGNPHELWATPRAQVDSTRTENGNPSKDGKILNQQVGGKLNPHWVSTLMGYPPLWAELGEKFNNPKIVKLRKETLDALVKFTTATPNSKP